MLVRNVASSSVGSGERSRFEKFPEFIACHLRFDGPARKVRKFQRYFHFAAPFIEAHSCKAACH